MGASPVPPGRQPARRARPRRMREPRVQRTQTPVTTEMGQRHSRYRPDGPAARRALVRAVDTQWRAWHTRGLLANLIEISTRPGAVKGIRWLMCTTSGANASRWVRTAPLHACDVPRRKRAARPGQRTDRRCRRTPALPPASTVAESRVAGYRPRRGRRLLPGQGARRAAVALDAANPFRWKLVATRRTRTFEVLPSFPESCRRPARASGARAAAGSRPSRARPFQQPFRHDS